MKGSSLIIGVGGHVVSIDPTTGNELWRTKLKRAEIITFTVQDGRIYAGANGEVYCLDPTAGTILWHNNLKGLGFGLVSFGSDQDAAASDRIAAKRRAAAAASAGG